MQTDQTLREMNEGTGTMHNMTNRVQETLHQGRQRLTDLSHNVTDLGKEYVRYTDTYVHENSWKAVGIAAVVGMVIGLLMNRRDY